MPAQVEIHVLKPFRLTLDDGSLLRFDAPGRYEVAQAVADHWFTKMHLTEPPPAILNPASAQHARILAEAANASEGHAAPIVGPLPAHPSSSGEGDGPDEGKDGEGEDGGEDGKGEGKGPAKEPEKAPPARKPPARRPVKK